MLHIGVDVGGTKTKAALVDEAGNCGLPGGKDCSVPCRALTVACEGLQVLQAELGNDAIGQLF